MMGINFCHTKVQHPHSSFVYRWKSKATNQKPRPIPPLRYCTASLTVDKGPQMQIALRTELWLSKMDAADESKSGHQLPASKTLAYVCEPTGLSKQSMRCPRTLCKRCVAPLPRSTAGVAPCSTLRYGMPKRSSSKFHCFRETPIEALKRRSSRPTEPNKRSATAMIIGSSIRPCCRRANRLVFGFLKWM